MEHHQTECDILDVLLGLPVESDTQRIPRHQVRGKEDLWILHTDIFHFDRTDSTRITDSLFYTNIPAVHGRGRGGE